MIEMKKCFGLFMLLFFPLVWLVDWTVGDYITKTKVSGAIRTKQIWNAWHSLYWRNKNAASIRSK